MSISRRDLLKVSGVFAAWSALAACSPIRQALETPTAIAGTEPTTIPPLDNEQLIAHTLRRITFGPTPEMVEKAKRIGLADFIEEQLHPETIADAGTEQMLERFSTLRMTPAERVLLDNQGQPVLELIAATLIRQWNTERQFYELMVDFWSNHFNIFIGKNLCRILKTDDDLETIRPNALGNFLELLTASAHSPAMLIYLDQADSRKEAPNENYARELLELHTVSVEQGYSHHDVAELARVLTGWTIVRPRAIRKKPGTFLFNPSIHDNGDKHVLGMDIPAGGEEEGTAVLEMLAAHPNTASFISRKLARRFVSDDPDPILVSDLAEVFTRTGGDIRAVVREMLNSDAFRASMGLKFKRPLEFLISALRVTNARYYRPFFLKLREHLQLLGQVPFTWQTPDGFPDVAEYWSTTSGLLERWNFGQLLVSGQIDSLQVDLDELTKDAGSAQDMVDVLSTRFIGGILPEDARSILVDYASGSDKRKILPTLAGLILGSPHFQIR